MGKEKAARKEASLYRPFVQAASPTELGEIMDQRDTSGNRTNAMAYCENPIEYELQSTLIKLFSDEEIRKILDYPSTYTQARKRSLESVFSNAITYIQSKYQTDNKLRSEFEKVLQFIVNEIVSISNSLPGYKLSIFGITYTPPEKSNSGNINTTKFHPDLNIDDVLDIYEEPTEKDLRVVRTYVGNSTEYLRGKTKDDEIVSPKPGSTTMHALPSRTLHREPKTEVGQVRIAFILNFVAIDN